MLCRNIVFTLNNPIENGGAELCDWLEEACIYGIIGCEYGESGTFHWQGYCELRKPVRMSTILGHGRKWHVERRRGTPDEAITYCRKDGNYVEWGTKRSQGQRNDLDKVRSTALESGMREVTATCNAQGIRVAEKFLTYNEPGRCWKPHVTYITGASGIGKSRRARELCSDDVYTKSNGTKWWNGYDGHEDVIIDDFRDSWWSLTYMLGILDRYPFELEYKGGSRQLLCKRIVITSIKKLDELYVNCGESLEQLYRRVDEVIDLDVADVAEVGGVILDPPDPYEDDNVPPALQM